MNQSVLGIVDLDHTAIGEKGLVRQCLPGRPDRRDPETHLLGRPDPCVGGELLERLDELRVEKDACQQPVRLHGDTIRIVPVRRVEPGGGQFVPFGRGEDPPGPERPVMDPFAVSTLVEALDRPRVDGPHPVQGRIRVLDPLPVQTGRCQCTLQE